MKIKVRDKVILKKRDYMIWEFTRRFGYCDTSKPYFRMCREYGETIGIIKGFQSPEFDGRDVIIRWGDFLWETTIPSKFLIKIGKLR